MKTLPLLAALLAGCINNHTDTNCDHRRLKVAAPAIQSIGASHAFAKVDTCTINVRYVLATTGMPELLSAKATSKGCSFLEQSASNSVMKTIYSPSKAIQQCQIGITYSHEALFPENNDQSGHFKILKKR